MQTIHVSLPAAGPAGSIVPFKIDDTTIAIVTPGQGLYIGSFGQFETCTTKSEQAAIDFCCDALCKHFEPFGLTVEFIVV